jgi:hypothetical protein
MRSSAAAVGRMTALAVLSLPLLVHGALSLDLPAHIAAVSTIAGRLLAVGLVAASAAPHTLAYLALLPAFAITLLPGREPLVTLIARRVSGPLEGEMMAYTRGVTWAWCIFFAAQLLTSFVLFWSAPLGMWSFFVNVLNLPLVALMFVGEYAFRGLYLRDPPRHTLADIRRAVGYFKESFSKRQRSR